MCLHVRAETSFHARGRRHLDYQVSHPTTAISQRQWCVTLSRPEPSRRPQEHPIRYPLGLFETWNGDTQRHLRSLLGHGFSAGVAHGCPVCLDYPRRRRMEQLVLESFGMTLGDRSESRSAFRPDLSIADSPWLCLPASVSLYPTRTKCFEAMPRWHRSGSAMTMASRFSC